MTREGFLSHQCREDHCVRQPGMIVWESCLSIWQLPTFASLPSKGPPTGKRFRAVAHTHCHCSPPRHFRPYSPHLRRTGRNRGCTVHFRIPSDPGCGRLEQAQMIFMSFISTSFGLQITWMVLVYLVSPSSEVSWIPECSAWRNECITNFLNSKCFWNGKFPF